MNSLLVKEALNTVVNPHVLINMVSQRVRQLNSGHGGRCRPLVANEANDSVADIALREIIEEKMSFEMPEVLALTRPTAKNRRRPQHWTKAA
jgi:DNA-directed RNA polymerase subunit omega